MSKIKVAIFTIFFVFSTYFLGYANTNNNVAFYGITPLRVYLPYIQNILSENSINISNPQKDLYELSNDKEEQANCHTSNCLYVLEKFLKPLDQKCILYESDNRDISKSVNDMLMSIDNAHALGAKVFLTCFMYTNQKGQASLNGGTQLFRALFEKCYQYPDMVFITSAGNTGEIIDEYLFMNGVKPNNLIVVGSCSVNGQISSWSTKGKFVDVYTLGEDIPIFLFDKNTYYAKSGTSFAAPIIAGICLEILRANNNIDGATLKQCIIKLSDSNKILMNNAIIIKMFLQK